MSNLQAVRFLFALCYIIPLFPDIEAHYAIATSEGATVHIPCSSSNPGTTVYWEYRPSLLANDEYVCLQGKILPKYLKQFDNKDLSAGNFSLVIYNVTLSNTGIYTCVENDGAGPQHHSRLFVFKKEDSSEYEATTGTVATIPCRAIVQTWVKWLYWPVNSTVSSSRMISKERNVEKPFRMKFALNNIDHDDYSLTIKNVQLSDAGWYTCVEDEGLESKHTIQLIVKNADINECASNPCLNHGTCQDETNEYSCRCVLGFTGVNCQTEANECASNPCQNNGTCVDGLDKFTCVCRDDFTGTNCEKCH